MLHKKSISCRQKQDDAAPEKYFVLKKLLIISETARHTELDNNLYMSGFPLAITQFFQSPF